MSGAENRVHSQVRYSTKEKKRDFLAAFWTPIKAIARGSSVNRNHSAHGFIINSQDIPVFTFIECNHSFRRVMMKRWEIQMEESHIPFHE
jgi:hypothetical protein